MQIVFALLGVFWTYFGMFVSIAIFMGSDTPFKFITSLSAFIFGGACFLAGLKKYRGNWWFISGGTLLVLTSFALAVEMKNRQLGIQDSTASWFIILLVLISFGIGLLKLGHQRHKRMEQTKKQLENEHSFFSNKKILIVCIAVLLGFGALNTVFQYESFTTQLVLAEGAFFNLVCYSWYYQDKRRREYPNSYLMNIAIVSLPLVFLPVYLFKSSPPWQAKTALVAFSAAFTYAHNLMFVGTIISSIILES